MHPHAQLLERLFTSLNRHDAGAMAEAYHPDARFRDIAFDLRGRTAIHDMWRMICAGDIRATFEVVEADDRQGRVRLVDEYTFTDTGRRVRNQIDSRFRFADGLIIEHHDVCDARAWAAMAIGGAGGFLAGRVGFLRRMKARRKLASFAQRAPSGTL
jgi:hypothetical protein